MLVAHNSEPVGWHVGRVRFHGVSKGWLKVCPTANYLLRYTKKQTNGDMTEGQEEAAETQAECWEAGHELSASNYGRDEWWVLLDPIAEASS